MWYVVLLQFRRGRTSPRLKKKTFNTVNVWSKALVSTIAYMILQQRSCSQRALLPLLEALSMFIFLLLLLFIKPLLQQNSAARVKHTRKCTLWGHRANQWGKKKKASSITNVPPLSCCCETNRLIFLTGTQRFYLLFQIVMRRNRPSLKFSCPLSNDPSS